MFQKKDILNVICYILYLYNEREKVREIESERYFIVDFIYCVCYNDIIYW